MADKSDEAAPPKPNFFSTLPGIITGIGGVLVALTGLITALVQAGAFSPKTNSNANQPVNTPVALSVAPAVAENDRYKVLNGAWELIETRPKSMGGAKVTWILNATVTGKVLRMTGKMTALNGKLVGTKGKETRAVFEINLADAAAKGFFETTPKNSPTIRFPAVMVDLKTEPPTTIHANINLPRNEYCGLMGEKLP